MNVLHTSKSAREYSKQGRIEEWIHSFLCGEGNNIPFSEGLKLEKRFYIGPLRMTLDMFQRFCGPEENMKYRMEKEGFEWRVSEIKNRFLSGWDMPPLIINYSNDEFELNDGNHRYEALLRSGIRDYDVILWTTAQEDYQRLKEIYGGSNSLYN